MGSGTPSLKELWKLGSRAVLCHPRENSVELGADTRLLGRSPRSLHNILAAKPWRVVASPRELQARGPLWSFLGELSLGSGCCRVGTGGKCGSCSSLETEQGLQGQRGCGILQWVHDLWRGRAVWCLSALEKVPSFLPDSCFFPDEMICALVVLRV